MRAPLDAAASAAPAAGASASPAATLVRHVAIIMDGNGRWAQRRGRPRTAGHVAGLRSVRRTVEGARRLGLPALTLYAFSSDNWRRPPREVSALMDLFRRYLALETARLREHDVRVSVIGRRDRLPADVLRLVAEAEAATRACTALHLRIAVDYSSRDAIVRAAAEYARHAGGRAGDERAGFAAALARAEHAGDVVPDVDLLIRTGGEQRLSDFLLWECAYAELLFIQTLWPDFTEADLAGALAEFGRRERRFGGV